MSEPNFNSCSRLNGKGNSCGAIVLRKSDNKTEVLMLSHGSRGWVFPKNRQIGNESEEAAAKREVLSAAGIEIDIVPGFRYEGSSAFKNEDRIMVYFAAYPISDELIVRNPDHSLPAWKAIEDVPSLLRFPEDYPPFHAVLEYLNR